MRSSGSRREQQRTSAPVSNGGADSRRSRTMQEMVPYDPFDDVFAHRLFQDSSSSMSSLLPSLMGSGGFDPFGSFGGFHSIVPRLDFGFGGQPQGQYQSQVMMMSTSVGADGQRHVEKYARAQAGNTEHRIRETREAYTNSASGIDRMSHGRELGTRGRRIFQERNRGTGEIVTNDDVVGMERETETDRFETDWGQMARDHLPRQPALPAAFGQPLLGRGTSTRAPLPAPPTRGQTQQQETRRKR